jgi:hypothetical protein
MIFSFILKGKSWNKEENFYVHHLVPVTFLYQQHAIEYRELSEFSIQSGRKYLVPRSGKSGAIDPPHCTSSWRGD